MEAGAHEALQTHLRAEMLLSGLSSRLFLSRMKLSMQHAPISVMQFFLGVGYPYFYLAETQLPRLAEETGVRFIWHGVYSPELLAGADAKRIALVNVFQAA
jgi:hypothetical protein